MHERSGGLAAPVGATFEQAAQIAIGKDAGHVPFSIDHDGGAQPFGRHFAHHGVEVGRERHGRRGIARAHHIGHGGEQLAPQCASWVGAGKIVGLEAACIQ